VVGFVVPDWTGGTNNWVRRVVLSLFFGPRPLIEDNSDRKTGEKMGINDE
jgi:hypothetical protein